ncbi:MAG: hypothetical protein R3C69_02000 [Geminicoccaceae bacterium]
MTAAKPRVTARNRRVKKVIGSMKGRPSLALMKPVLQRKTKSGGAPMARRSARLTGATFEQAHDDGVVGRHGE